MSDKKRALVIGGSSGMGLAGVQALLEQGWNVAVADLQESEHISNTAFFKVDLAEPDAVSRVVSEAAKELGGLDAVWNHVGICRTGTAETMELEDLDASWALNVRVNAILAREVIPHLRAAGGGSLLFSSSAAGVMVNPGTLPYVLTKSALVTLTRQLAAEVAGDNIRVNTICSGWVDTPFNAPAWEMMGGRESFLQKVPDLVPLGRMADPNEIGSTVAFLLSAPASFITGQAVVIDGGESLIKGATR